MTGKILITLEIKEDNGQHLTTIDKYKNLPPNTAIEILKIKYSTTGLFKKISQGFEKWADELETILYQQDQKHGRKPNR